MVAKKLKEVCIKLTVVYTKCIDREWNVCVLKSVYFLISLYSYSQAFMITEVFLPSSMCTVECGYVSWAGAAADTYRTLHTWAWGRPLPGPAGQGCLPSGALRSQAQPGSGGTEPGPPQPSAPPAGPPEPAPACPLARQRVMCGRQRER